MTLAFGIKKSFFGRLKEKIENVIFMRPVVDEAMLDELEEALITSDIGMETTMKIVAELRDAVRMERLTRPEDVRQRIISIVERLVDKGDRHMLSAELPLIILMIGVNGGGKTTSIAKMANLFKRKGHTVLLAAADTFRAAAGEQLEVWAARADVNVIKHQEGADPSAVIFDAIQSAKAKNVDVVICDTAGRLQTKRNLMAELEKMNKVISREFPAAARETLLVLDATTGKNAISQAKEFGSVTDISGIVLTKMDGTAKGGIIITISDEFDLPVKFIGVGEKIDDLKPFDPKEFAAGIFEEEDGVAEELVDQALAEAEAAKLAESEAIDDKTEPEQVVAVDIEPELAQEPDIGTEYVRGPTAEIEPEQGTADIEPEPALLATADTKIEPEQAREEISEIEPEQVREEADETEPEQEREAATETEFAAEVSAEPGQEPEPDTEPLQEAAEAPAEEEAKPKEKRGFWGFFRRK
ncbi:hypothetical protein FACS1894127_6030 [Clostridia bacterium]|nr:hypothetical protein FACS1894127_6030 [Clostridia bacterium]